MPGMFKQKPMQNQMIGPKPAPPRNPAPASVGPRVAPKPMPGSAPMSRSARMQRPATGMSVAAPKRATPGFGNDVIGGKVKV